MSTAILPTPELLFFADLRVSGATPQEVGATVHGRRRLIPITGGEAVGEGWRARWAGNWQSCRTVRWSNRAAPRHCWPSLGMPIRAACWPPIRPAGRCPRYACHVLRTDGGDLNNVQNTAVRSGPPELMARLARGEVVPPEQIYFRCFPRFETAAPSLAWISERLFVGTGARHPDSVQMRFFELK